MLVLSRRVDDSILFPDLGISIEILQLKGKSVRVGVDAPIEIRVVRGELKDDESPGCHRFDLTGSTEHKLRNKLNTLRVASAFAKELIERGEYNFAASQLHQALSALEGECQDDDVLSALVVEDVAEEREMLAGILRRHGMNVATASNCERAVSHLESNPKPDFLVIDIGLPGRSGTDLISYVRSNPAFDQVELFAISGQTPEQARVDLDKNRIANWFQKPLTPNRLIQEIEHSRRPHPVA